MAKPSNLTQAKDAYMAKRRQDIENAYYSGVSDGLAVLDRS